MRRKEKGISLELRSHWFNCKRITTTTMTTNRMKIVRLHSYLILIVHDPANQITIITHAHALARSTQRKNTIFLRTAIIQSIHIVRVRCMQTCALIQTYEKVNAS